MSTRRAARRAPLSEVRGRCSSSLSGRVSGHVSAPAVRAEPKGLGGTTAGEVSEWLGPCSTSGILHVSAGPSTPRRLASVLVVAGAIALVSGVLTVLAANDTNGERVGIAVGGGGLLGLLISAPIYFLSATRIRFE